MKNISKKLLIVFIIFAVICSICNISKAVNETVNVDTNLIQPRAIENGEDDPYSINPISIDGEASEGGVQLEPDTGYSTEDTNNYFSFTSEDVVIDKHIYGDVFVFTSGSVTINEPISGNAFIFSDSIQISKGSEISGSLFAFSKSLTIDGYVNTNVYAFTEKFTLNQDSNIFFDLFVAAGNIEINGSVGRNVYSSCESLSITESGRIYGNLEYTANDEANILDGTVSGKIDFVKTSPNAQEETSTALEVVLNIVSYIVFVVVLFAIYKLLKLKFATNPNFLKDNLGKCILFGLLGLFIIPVLCIILLLVGGISVLSVVLSEATLILVLILLAIYALLLMVASSTTIVVISNLIAEKIKPNSTLISILSICLLGVAYKLLSLVPMLNILISFALIVIGIGVWIKNILPENKAQ